MKSKFAVGLAVAAFAGLASPYALSAPLTLTNGDKITLDWGAPSFGHDLGGGEFVAKGVGPVLSTKDSFLTFCIEYPEHISLSTAYYVKLNTAAVNGGYSNVATYAGDVAGTTGNDPLSFATAWLYTQFRTNTAVLAGGWVNDNAHANAMQLAIWKLEGELNGSATDPGSSLYKYNHNALAQGWYTQASTAGATSLGRVRVMNLYDTYNARTGVFSGNHQDQLYLMPVPEPETYAMMLAGLGLMGFVAKRRRRQYA